jgi:hypothetical protein
MWLNYTFMEHKAVIVRMSRCSSFYYFTKFVLSFQRLHGRFYSGIIKKGASLRGGLILKL